MSTSESVSPPPPKTIVLKSSDGECFVVEESVAVLCETIKNMIEDECTGAVIPLPNVSSKILSKVIDYCKHHAKSKAAAVPEAAIPSSGKEIVGGELKKFDDMFVKVDRATLFDLILAANYLNVKTLLDLTCQTVADMIKDMKVEEVRKLFNIENDFTPEEEKAIREENAWAFE